MEIILYIIGFALPMLSYGLIGHFFGEIAPFLFFKSVSKPKPFLDSSASSLLSWAVGLELHLVLAFGLYVIFGVPIFSAYWLAFLFSATIPIYFICKFFNRRDFFSDYYIYNPFKTLSLNGVAFFILIFWIGIGIYSVDEGLKTLWPNNYGDISIHLGLIMNYIYGAIPLKEYHIFPGEYLSYSVLVDFWSALLISADPGLRTLQAVFIIQWVIVWTFSFISLSRNGHKIFPWVVLLGGGTWLQFLANIDLFQYTDGMRGYSHILIDKGFPITNLLSCIWIPQRTTLYGLFTLVVGMSAFSEYFVKPNRDDSDEVTKSRILFQIGALFGISFLANFHMALVGSLIVGLFILAPAIIDLVSNRKLNVLFFSFVISSFLCAFAVYFQYSDKASMIKFVPGWMMKTQGDDKILYFFKLWGLNLTFLILPIFYLLSRLQIKLAFIHVLIFFMGYFISFSDWSWDNYKLFIGLFIALLITAGSRCKPRESIVLLLFLSIVPGIYESGKIFIMDVENVVYSNQSIFEADQIRINTPRDAIIAGTPSHNSSITLAGRKIFYGYPGWLGSHNIRENGRSNINSNAKAIKSCSQSNSVCPDYVMVGIVTKASLESEGFIKTPLPYLYKVPKS